VQNIESKRAERRRKKKRKEKERKRKTWTIERTFLYFVAGKAKNYGYLIVFHRYWKKRCSGRSKELILFFTLN